MMLDETSFEFNGLIYFKRVWKCSHNRWEKTFLWNDIDAASYIPICERCLNGALQFS